jgi:hypothetical protein
VAAAVKIRVPPLIIFPQYQRMLRSAVLLWFKNLELGRLQSLRYRCFLIAGKIRVLSSAMSMDRSVFSFRSARGSASADLKNTPRIAACKRTHGAPGTNKLPMSKRSHGAQQQRFDLPRGFFGMSHARGCFRLQKIFATMPAKMAVLPYFPGPRAVCRVSLYVNADFLARIFT